ncbi:hypothetical protein IV203_030239 [Nitzschia inconspicua]|uniref:Uncharacterized protein n=1 Tax=Nitzschia inconspicua TaxID=303405 RepID=A0A9K3LS65_9STRA|nr:hypothetical protein IV203_030239 [Nitzschia inconspicua]
MKGPTDSAQQLLYQDESVQLNFFGRGKLICAVASRVILNLDLVMDNRATYKLKSSNLDIDYTRFWTFWVGNFNAESFRFMQGHLRFLEFEAAISPLKPSRNDYGKKRESWFLCLLEKG